MPSLNNLPTEVLFIVARYLGSNYLRARVDRLLICKAWYSVAQSVAMEQIILTAETRHYELTGRQMRRRNDGQRRRRPPLKDNDLLCTLQRFLAAPKSSQRLVKTNTKDLFIQAKDLLQYPLTYGPTGMKLETDHTDFRFRDQRTLEIYEKLDSITTHLPEIPNLQKFSLQLIVGKRVCHQFKISLCSKMIPLVSSLPKTLTSLTIDNAGVEEFKSIARKDYYISDYLCPHFCPLPLSLLPCLRHLHIRTRSICPRLFDLENPKEQCHLETMVINLCNFEGSPIEPKYIRSCQFDKISKHDLYPQMKQAAKAATARFPSIRIFRVLGYGSRDPDTKRFGVYSYDAITDKSIMLSDAFVESMPDAWMMSDDFMDSSFSGS